MSIDAMKQALEALEDGLQWSAEHSDVRAALRAAIEQAERPQTHSEECWRWHHQCAVVKIERMHAQAPTMDDAIAAGDSVIMNEQAALLRECRAALDSLIKQRPTLAGLLCGSTTLGNLKAELGAYRPQGVFGVQAETRSQKLAKAGYKRRPSAKSLPSDE